MKRQKRGEGNAVRVLKLRKGFVTILGEFSLPWDVDQGADGVYLAMHTEQYQRSETRIIVLLIIISCLNKNESSKRHNITDRLKILRDHILLVNPSIMGTTTS